MAESRIRVAIPDGYLLVKKEELVKIANRVASAENLLDACLKDYTFAFSPMANKIKEHKQIYTDENYPNPLGESNASRIPRQNS